MGIGNLFVLLILADTVSAQLSTDRPSDKAATTETVALYKGLKRLSHKGFLFGHQDDLAYGVNWRYEPNRSDVKETCGDFPGLYGWDISGIETGDSANIDGVPFALMHQYIQEGYDRGGVITISWHMKSPIGAKGGAWDTSHLTVASILPGGSEHGRYTAWLDQAAKFIGDLKGKNGESVPVLFRMFHELTGGWFWWGSKACTPQEFRSLWMFTVNYFEKEKNLHNLLWVYNTSGDIHQANDFLERYPGDEAVDLLSFDAYQSNPSSGYEDFEKNISATLDIVQQIATDKNKPYAIGETGYEAVPYASWWTDVLLKAIGKHAISYLLVWRNQGKLKGTGHLHYYAPYPGQASAANFVQFYSLPNTLFEKDAAKEVLYENKN